VGGFFALERVFAPLISSAKSVLGRTDRARAADLSEAPQGCCDRSAYRPLWCVLPYHYVVKVLRIGSSGEKWRVCCSSLPRWFTGRGEGAPALAVCSTWNGPMGSLSRSQLFHVEHSQVRCVGSTRRVGRVFNGIQVNRKSASVLDTVVARLDRLNVPRGTHGGSVHRWSPRFRKVALFRILPPSVQ